MFESVTFISSKVDPQMLYFGCHIHRIYLHFHGTTNTILCVDYLVSGYKNTIIGGIWMFIITSRVHVIWDRVSFQLTHGLGSWMTAMPGMTGDGAMTMTFQKWWRRWWRRLLVEPLRTFTIVVLLVMHQKNYVDCSQGFRKWCYSFSFIVQYLEFNSWTVYIFGCSKQSGICMWQNLAGSPFLDNLT